VVLNNKKETINLLAQIIVTVIVRTITQIEIKSKITNEEKNLLQSLFNKLNLKKKQKKIKIEILSAKVEISKSEVHLEIYSP